MANEIHFPYITEQTLYGLVWNGTGQIWNGSAFVAFVPASWATYAVTLTENGASGHYFADFTVSATYQVDIYQRAGGTPAATDVLVGQGDIAPEDATSATLATVLADVVAIKAITDAMGTSAVTLISPAAVNGSDITGLRGDRWVVSLTGLGSIAGRNKLWFTVKARVDDADTAAVLQITEGGGLVRLNGSASLPAGISTADGDINVTDETAGDITITIEAAVTALFNTGQHFNYDIQVLTGTAVATKVVGSLKLTADVTLATS